VYYIIETKEQLEKFSKYDFSKCVVDIVPHNDHCHNKISPICLVYIKPFRSRTGFILPIDHEEAFSLPLADVVSFIDHTVGQIYAVDAKRFRYYFNRKEALFCLKTGLYLKSGKILDESSFNTKAHRYFQQKFGNDLAVNKLIPISKHYEKMQSLYSSFEDIDKMFTRGYQKFYSDMAVEIFYQIEKNGIKVNQKELKKHFTLKDPLFSIKDDIIYSSYNMFTVTGRPSNAFNGINFAALNKEDGSRSAIRSKNNYLIEFDYSSYHLRILCELIDYKFDETDIHTHLAKSYFEKDEISKEEYDESKKLTFKLLYTETDIPELENVPFIWKVREFKNTLWDNYKKTKRLDSPISKKPITGIESKTQILPYLLQNYETERNIMILSEVLKCLEGKKSELVLYCYDSFLIDYSKEDGKELLNCIQETLEQGGFATSCRYGKNYQEMKTL